MNLEIEKRIFDAIAKAIHSDQSPVGIDAKKTHVIILQKLLEIEQRLDRIEQKIGEQHG